MITIVCFLWAPRYTAAHVNTLRTGLERYLTTPHRLVCVTDIPAGIDSRVGIVQQDRRLSEIKRFRKLALFSRDAKERFGGDRLLSVDLDVTPVGELDSLVARTEDFVIWRDPLFGRAGYEVTHRYNSSLILMNAGCRPQVYETFNGDTAVDDIRTAKLVGSDQAWIGLTLGPDEAVWTQADGVLGFKHDLGWHPWTGKTGREWPADAKLIISHGNPKPWDLDHDHPLRRAYERNSNG